MSMLRKGFSGNALKILAMIAMTCDHVGLMFFPQATFLRIIGRLAMPIYAYMIAQGCRHTRSRARYFAHLFSLALVCQIVYLIAMGSLYQCILVTFSLSVVLICLADYARRLPKVLGALLMAVALGGVFFLSEVLPGLLRGTDFAIVYGFFGILLPVLIYLGRNRVQELAMAAVPLVGLSIGGGIQWFGLCALPLLALYNGQRGKYKLKYLFYFYYPAHLALIQLLAWVL